MKTLRNLTLSFVICTAAVTPVITGCKTTPSVIAYKTLGATVQSVDTALKIWAESYVRHMKAADTDEKQLKLHNEYNLVNVAKLKYNAALTIAFGAVEQAYAADPNSVTPPDVNFSAGNLLTIIKTLAN